MALPLNWLKRFFPIIFRARTTTGANIPFPSLIFFIIGRNLTGFATRTTSGTDLISTMLLSPQTEVPQPPWKEEERGLCSPVAEIEVAMKKGGRSKSNSSKYLQWWLKGFYQHAETWNGNIDDGFCMICEKGIFLWSCVRDWMELRERERELRSHFLIHTNWWLGFLV